MSRAWCSLSGSALEGSALTRFVYIDETGISNPDHEPFLVVAGVIVNADQHVAALERSLERLADRFIPDEHREGFYFHAKDLFPGSGPVFGKKGPLHDYDQRMEIADALAKIPKRLNLTIPCGIVDRANWPLSDDVRALNEKQKISKKERRAGEHLTAYMACVMDVEMWMRANASGEIAVIVAEDNKDMKRRLKATHNAFRKKSVELTLPKEGRKYFPFKKIKTSPLFEEKEDSVALQMADFCAYVLKRRAMNDSRINRVFDVIAPRMARPV